MNLFEHFKTDDLAETEGISITIGEAEFTVARAGGKNLKFQRAMSRLLGKHKAAFDSGTLDPDIGDKLATRAIAETVVIGWSNVKDAKDKPIPYTVENCFNLLVELPDLRDLLFNQAKDHSNFIYAAREEDAGKSENS